MISLGRNKRMIVVYGQGQGDWNRRIKWEEEIRGGKEWNMERKLGAI